MNNLFSVGKHNVYRLSASTAEEKDDWIACLTRKVR